MSVATDGRTTVMHFDRINVKFCVLRMAVKPKDLTERGNMQHYAVNVWNMKTGINKTRKEGT
jgi:hypothetical protein